MFYWLFYDTEVGFNSPPRLVSSLCAKVCFEYGILELSRVLLLFPSASLFPFPFPFPLPPQPPLCLPRISPFLRTAVSRMEWSSATPSSYPTISPQRRPAVPTIFPPHPPRPLSPHHAVARRSGSGSGSLQTPSLLEPCAVGADDAGENRSWLIRKVECAFLAALSQFAHDHDSSEMGIL